MKNAVRLALLAGLLCLVLAGCQNPNALQMDLRQGYGDKLKLLHLNANDSENFQLMEDFGDVIRSGEALEKDISLFAYYPDYQLELSQWEGGQSLTVLIDLNGDYVDFIYPGPTPEPDNTVYRSQVTAQEFLALVNHVYE